MRLPLLPVIIVLLSGLSVDWYLLRRMKGCKCLSRARAYHIIISALVTIGMFVVAVAPKKAASDSQLTVFMWAIFTYFSVYVPKYIIALFALVQQGLSHLFHRRLRAIPIFGSVIGIALFIMMWWGALFTRFSIDVRRVDVAIENLPPAFRGYTIVQLSDIHTGTFADNPRFLEKVVNTVNDLHPDIVLFTGDIVNRHSSELEPFMATLSGIHAPDGVWSVMGNHDYGEYYRWKSESDRYADIENLKSMQSQMGWNMLNNAHTAIRRANDSIILIGVENIGDPPFTTYGNLRKAYPRLDDSSTKILMTHNPAHWTDSIADHPDVNIALSLSGHTHAMQIRLLGWSPSDIRYRTWGGLYTDSLGRSLYVNIGLGEVGFPSRIGATPEVTLITLTDK